MRGDIIYLEFSLNHNRVSETLNFYETLFHWKFTESFLSSKKYFMFETPSKTLSGGFDENTLSSTQGTLVYMDCEDIHMTLSFIESNFPSAMILKRKTLISKDFGSFAIIIDPSGNRIGVQQSPKKEN